MVDDKSRTQDVHVSRFEPLDSPRVIKAALPITKESEASVLKGRAELRKALAGNDRRMVVIVGPCSIHDSKSALEYAERLVRLRRSIEKQVLVIMRVYFEKPRTRLGWKGLINDPLLDGSSNVNLGLRKAREILLAINGMGLPCASEFLDPIVPQYTADLVTWAAIGARTTESQTHREMASGLSMPVGFKNSTDGDLQVALDALVSARHSHSFLGIDQEGQTSIVRTNGNSDVHLVLRGGIKPNYSPENIALAKVSLGASEKRRIILVDCSHGNCEKDFRRQPVVFKAMLRQLVAGERILLGAMLESHLNEGKQKLEPGTDLRYGVSLTDGCINWDTTEKLLTMASEEIK